MVVTEEGLGEGNVGRRVWDGGGGMEEERREGEGNETNCDVKLVANDMGEG